MASSSPALSRDGPRAESSAGTNDDDVDSDVDPAMAWPEEVGSAEPATERFPDDKAGSCYEERNAGTNERKLTGRNTIRSRRQRHAVRVSFRARSSLARDLFIGGSKEHPSWKCPAPGYTGRPRPTGPNAMYRPPVQASSPLRGEAEKLAGRVAPLTSSVGRSASSSLSPPETRRRLGREGGRAASGGGEALAGGCPASLRA